MATDIRQTEITNAQSNPGIINSLVGASAPTPATPPPNVQQAAQDVSKELYGSGFVQQQSGNREAMMQELFKADQDLEKTYSGQSPYSGYAGYVSNPADQVAALSGYTGRLASNIGYTGNVIQSTESAYQNATNAVVSNLLDYLKLKEQKEQAEEDRKDRAFERELEIAKITGGSITDPKTGKTYNIPNPNSDGDFLSNIAKSNVEKSENLDEKINTEDDLQLQYQAAWNSTNNRNKKEAIADLWNSSHDYKLFEPRPLSEQEKASQKANESKKTIINTAQSVIDIIKNKNKFKSKKEYEDSLRTAVSDYNARGFTEGGKSLTGSELSILAGRNVVVENPRELTFWDKLVGNPKPSASGKILDDEETILNKLNYVVNGLGGVTNQEQLQDQNIPSWAKPEKTIGGLIGNVGRNAKDIINSLAGAPSQIISLIGEQGTEMKNAAMEGDFKRFNEAKSMLPKALIEGVVGGTVSSLNNLLGRPLEGGDVVQRAIDNAYENPIDVAMWILPATKMLKTSKGGTITKLANPELVGENTTKGAMLRKLVNVNDKDIIKSTQVANDVFSMAGDAKTYGEMAVKVKKDMLPKLGKFIEQKAKIADNKLKGLIGVDDTVGEIVNAVENKLGNLPNNLRNEFTKYLNNKLSVGSLMEETGGKEINGTNFSAMNKTRMDMSKNIPESWYKHKGASNPNDLRSSAYFYGNQAIKDLLVDAKELGNDFKDAVRLQESSIISYPILSKMANQKVSINNFWQIPYAALKTFIGPAYERAKVQVGKMSSNKPSVLEDVLKTESVEQSTSKINPISPSMNRKPLENEIINKINKSKGSAQLERLQSEGIETNSRRGQEKYIRESKKAKYK